MSTAARPATETFGEGTQLALGVIWDELRPPSTATADEATAGKVTVRLGGATIWGGVVAGDAGFHWTWIDALEHLARVWPRLRFEQRDPLGLDVALPWLRAHARRRWADTELSSPERDLEERRVWGFLEAHDLAAGLGGIQTPSLFVLRQGEEATLWAENDEVTLPLMQVLGTLEAFGAAIDARLVALDDGRAREARRCWQQRNALAASDPRFLRIATGLEEQALLELAGKRSLAEAFELGEAANDNELLAVARLGAGRVPRAILSKVLDLVRSAKCSKASVSKLDALGAEAIADLRASGTQYPYEAGYHAANWLRARMDNRRGPVKPQAVLESWGVSLREIELAAPNLEAVSIWGPSHGPAVFINLHGKRTRRAEGMRATLAHEIAHLLLDRQGALPLADVLGGRAPAIVEKRANAFAAELLLPRAVAGGSFEACRTRGVGEKRLASIRRRFGVSAEIIAWQALRSEVALAGPVRTLLLDKLPPERRQQMES